MSTFLMPPGRQRGWTNSGDPAAGCLLYTYEAGTTTLKATYTDADKTAEHTNPIVLDAKGEALIYWDGNYKVDLRTAAGVQISGYPIDNFETPVMPAALSDDEGAGMVGFLYGSTYGVGTLGRWLKDLALSTGSSFIGFIQTGAGAVLRTLQDKFRDIPHVKDFGAICDGVIDDSAAWQLAIDTGARVIDARGVNSKILTQINLASNQTLLLSGANIVTGGTTLKTFSAVSKSKFNLDGPFTIIGDLVTNPGTSVSSCGIYIEDCAKFNITEPTVLNIKGYGIRLEPGAGITPRGDHGTISNPRIDGCVWGWKDTAGSGAEYCTVLNIQVTGCSEAGIESAAGNILWQGGHCVDNLKDGFRMFGGSNNAHGIVTGMNINHHPQYSFVADGVTNGQTLAGCHFYANGATGAGAIYFKNSKGIVIDGGILDCWIYNDTGATSGLNYIKNMYCPGDYGDAKLSTTNAGLDELVVLGNYGPGAYNSGATINTPQRLFLAVERAASFPQSITSGFATVLNFPTNVADRRETFSATSVFTVPTGEAGWYRAGGNQYFSGDTINSAASFLQIKKNATVVDGFLPSALYGLGGIGFCHETRGIHLDVGDTLTMVATITGTGVIYHGAPDWRCSFTVERVA